jgi:hypothetical protein
MIVMRIEFKFGFDGTNIFLSQIPKTYNQV